MQKDILKLSDVIVMMLIDYVSTWLLTWKVSE